MPDQKDPNQADTKTQPAGMSGANMPDQKDPNQADAKTQPAGISSANMPDQKNLKQADAKTQLAGMSRAKRELVTRRDETSKQLESLQKELKGLQEGPSLSMFKEAIEIEVKRQSELKGEIEKHVEEIRSLRTKKKKSEEEYNLATKYIRELQQDIAGHKQVLASPNASKEEKETAKALIKEKSESDIPNWRVVQAEAASSRASISTDISHKMGEREHTEYELSRSRRDVRELKSSQAESIQLEDKASKAAAKEKGLDQALVDYETQRKSKAIKEAESITPQSVMKQAMASRELDPEFESEIAAKEFQKKGASGSETEEYRKTIQALTELVNQLKSTKKALAELEEGTEEYQEKQEELKEIEIKTQDKARQAGRMERFQALRDTPTRGSRAVDAIGGAVSGAFNLASSAAGAMGDLATNRYVLEEQKKQAELRLKGQSFQDWQNRSTDATAFLATGGAKFFGAEMPYDKKGNITGRIDKLGEDVPRTRTAASQYEYGTKLMGDLANMGTKTISSALKGGAAASAIGVGAPMGMLIGSGEGFIESSAQVGSRLAEGAFNPAVGGRFGGRKLAQGAHEGISSIGRDFTDFASDKVAAFAGKGGGDAAKAKEGAQQIGGAVTGLATAIPKLLDRGYQAFEEQNRLVAATTKGQQVQNVKERLQMAFAPAVQAYMDVQGGQRQALRSRVASRQEREQEEMRLEGGMLNAELGERGFGAQEIAARQGQAAETLGRFGKGGADINVARSAMMGQSIGLGSAQQSISAMGKMLQGGVDDPEAMFRKAMTEGLQKGLQDSRQFQQLLDFAGQTADSTIGFEGALEGILKASGSGRAGDAQTAAAAYKGIADDMSGSTGTWTDMIKFETTTNAAAQAIKAGREKGVNVGQEDITTLQNLTNFSLDDLQNEDFVKASLTPNARKAVEASHGSVKAYAQKLRESHITRGTFDRAIDATQSKDLSDVRDKMIRGDKEGLQRMFGQHEGATEAEKKEGAERLEKVKAQLISGSRVGKGSTDEALGSMQMAKNSLENMGINVGSIATDRAYEKKDLETALKEGRPATTMSEQQSKKAALEEQEKVATSVGAFRRDPVTGKNVGAEEMGRDPAGEYKRRQADIAGATKKSTTVDPTLKVETIDKELADLAEGFKKLKESFKNFSVDSLVLNAAGDVTIAAKKAISGIMLDNGLMRAASAAGEAIADAVNEKMGGSKKTDAQKQLSSHMKQAVAGPMGP